MIGINKVILNLDQVKDVLKKHLADEVLKDSGFAVQDIAFDGTDATITIGPLNVPVITE
jgi:hypothetical protein